MVMIGAFEEIDMLERDKWLIREVKQVVSDALNHFFKRILARHF
jgi:hypothetical protein